MKCSIVGFALILYASSLEVEAQMTWASIVDVQSNLLWLASNVNNNAEQETVWKELQTAKSMVNSSGYTIYRPHVLLLCGEYYYNYGSNQEGGLGEITSELRSHDLQPWQVYLVRLYELRSIAQTNSEQLSLSDLDWMIEHHDSLSVIDDELGRVIIRAIAGEHDAILAGFYDAQAGMLLKSGKVSEARDTYQKIIQDYPDTKWARSAKYGLISISANQQNK